MDSDTSYGISCRKTGVNSCSILQHWTMNHVPPMQVCAVIAASLGTMCEAVTGFVDAVREHVLGTKDHA